MSISLSQTLQQNSKKEPHGAQTRTRTGSLVCAASSVLSFGRLEPVSYSFAYVAHLGLCLNLNWECCRSKQTRYQLSHPSPPRHVHYQLWVPVKCSRTFKTKHKKYRTKTQFIYALTQGIAADEDIDGARLEPWQHLLPFHLHQTGQLSCTANPSIIRIINQSVSASNQSINHPHPINQSS